MPDDRRSPMEIPDEVARAANMPEDLDSSLVGPYTFPSLRRRRNGALVLGVGAVLAIAGAAAGLPRGLFVAAAALAVGAVWHLAAAWPLAVDEASALEVANRQTEFAVGHASAAVGFDGWRAKPIWNVLVFSADDPPSRRGLVRVDAVDGSVVATYVEDNPEV
jgi:hypothetical protein